MTGKLQNDTQFDGVHFFGVTPKSFKVFFDDSPNIVVGLDDTYQLLKLPRFLWRGALRDGDEVAMTQTGSLIWTYIEGILSKNLGI
jgi:hypothetical protein